MVTVGTKTRAWPKRAINSIPIVVFLNLIAATKWTWPSAWYLWKLSNNSFLVVAPSTIKLQSRQHDFPHSKPLLLFPFYHTWGKVTRSIPFSLSSKYGIVDLYYLRGVYMSSDKQMKAYFSSAASHPFFIHSGWSWYDYLLYLGLMFGILHSKETLSDFIQQAGIWGPPLLSFTDFTDSCSIILMLWHLLCKRCFHLWAYRGHYL